MERIKEFELEPQEMPLFYDPIGSLSHQLMESTRENTANQQRKTIAPPSRGQRMVDNRIEQVIQDLGRLVETKAS